MTSNSIDAKKNPFIDLRDLTKSYYEGSSEKLVINQVNIKINHSEMIILLGKSGSGKSTLLNLISGIDLPTSGEIVIDNQNLTKFSEQNRTLFRRKNIGFVFQFFNLIATLTVAENLMLPLELNGIEGKMAHDLALSMLHDVGLQDRASSYPDRLSGGEQQRVAIARALIHSPSLILADEPTGNLDNETGTQIINLLDRLVRKNHKTMIMATHSQEVIGMADRIFSIKDGRLIECPPNEAC